MLFSHFGHYLSYFYLHNRHSNILYPPHPPAPFALLPRKRPHAGYGPDKKQRRKIVILAIKNRPDLLNTAYFLQTDLIQTRNNVSQIQPWCSALRHLMEQIVPKKLQQIPVTSLRPAWIHAEPAKEWGRVTKCAKKKKKTHNIGQQTSPACMFCFPHVGHVIIYQRTAYFKFRLLHLHIYARSRLRHNL